MTYSQNKEDLFIANYFGDHKGTLLSIGENDGTTLSNARLLIENGWGGHLVEPSGVFPELKSLYENNPGVFCYNIAIGDKKGLMELYESGAHVPGGTDRALVSSLDKQEIERWKKCGVTFEAVQVAVLPFADLWLMTGLARFDFISIDAENYDWLILQQIDLTAVGCKCLCIEWNGDELLKSYFTKYCAKHGLGPAIVNRENIIFIK